MQNVANNWVIYIVWERVLETKHTENILPESKKSTSSCTSIHEPITEKKTFELKNKQIRLIVRKKKVKRTIFSPEPNSRNTISKQDSGKFI